MKMSRIRVAVITACVAVMIGTINGPGAVALSAHNSVDQTIRNETGAAATLMVAPQHIGDTSIGVGRSAGKALESFSQTPDAKSKRVLAVIEDASQSTVTYPVIAPAGAKVEPKADGSIEIVGSESLAVGPPIVGQPVGTTTTQAQVITIKAPWAVDATGTSLPTSYTFANGILTQTVDTTGASFPIVADPWVTLGIYIYVHIPSWLLLNAYHNNNTYYKMGVASCVQFGAGGPLRVVIGAWCGVYMISAMDNLGNNIYIAAHQVWNGPYACTVARFIYMPPGVMPPYVGANEERCTY
jgi:hypothetical protein